MPTSTALPRSRRDAVAVPRGRLRLDHAANPNESWIGLWETNRGCPFRCTFCDWGSATAGKVTKFGDRAAVTPKSTGSPRRRSNTSSAATPISASRSATSTSPNYVAKVKKATGYPVALSVQNTKNATERAYLTQKILSDAGLNKGVALSMQSVDMTDARGDQARQHLARHLHGAAAPLHARQGRDLLAT